MNLNLLAKLLLALSFTALVACGSSSSSDSDDIDLPGGNGNGSDNGTDTGNGGDGDSGADDQVSFTLDPDLSGSISAAGFDLTRTAAGDGPTRVGYTASGMGQNHRGFVSFDISELDAELMGIEVDQAHLRVWVSEENGNPGDNLGELYAWLVDYGEELSASDYDTTTGLYDSGGGFSTETGEGWRSLDVTGVIRAAVDNREHLDNRIQLLLRHSFEPNAMDNSHVITVCLELDCDGEGGPAELVIELHDPF